MSQTFIGLLFVFQLTGSWGSTLFGRLTESYSRALLISIAVLMAMVGALLTLSSHIMIIIIGLILFASGFFAGHSIASGWINFTVAPQWNSYASSLYLLFYYTGSSVIGWLGGVFLSTYAWPGVIFMICSILSLSSILVWHLARMQKEHVIHNL